MDPRGTLMHDICTLESNINSDGDQGITKEPWAYDRKKFQKLDADIRDAFVSLTVPGLDPGTEALIHPRCTIRGLQYAEMHGGGKNTGGRNSIVYFRPTSGLKSVPGLIRKIFSVPKRNRDGKEEQAVFLAIHRYQMLPDIAGVQNPFLQYEAFGAQLWSSALGSVEVIAPEQVICHGNRRRWKDGVVVLRPNDRVSHISLHNANRLTYCPIIELLKVTFTRQRVNRPFIAINC